MLWIITGTGIRHDILRHCICNPFLRSMKRLELEWDARQELIVAKTGTGSYVPLEPYMLDNVELVSASPMVLTTPFYMRMLINRNTPVKTIAVVEQILKRDAPEKDHRDKTLCRQLENTLKEINREHPPVMGLTTLTSENHYHGYIMEEDCLKDLSDIVIKIINSIIHTGALVDRRMALLNPWEIYLFRKKYGLDSLDAADIYFTVAGNQNAFEELMGITEKRETAEKKAPCHDCLKQNAPAQVESEAGGTGP